LDIKTAGCSLLDKRRNSILEYLKVDADENLAQYKQKCWEGGSY
jgi:hypothetical protein